MNKILILLCFAVALARGQSVFTAEGLMSFAGIAPTGVVPMLNYLALAGEPPGTMVTPALLYADVIPTNSGNFGLVSSDNAANQFVVWTNGPAFPNPIQVGGTLYSGTESHSIQMSNDLNFSTIEFQLPPENSLPYLMVSGFVKVPALPNTAATYDLLVLGASLHSPPYWTEDWTLQLNCGQVNYIQFEDANGITGTVKVNATPFPTDRWLFFTMTMDTVNRVETGAVYDASTWSLITSCSRQVAQTNVFVDYWLFGNNEAGSAPGLRFYFAGLNWTNTLPPPPPPPYTTPTNQLIAQFKFNGDLIDSSLNGFDGSEFGGTFNFVPGQDGVAGHAIALTNAIVSDTQAPHATQATTINYWVNTGGGGMPVAQGEFSSWYTFVNGDGTGAFDLYTSGGHATVTSTGNYFGGWHMLTATWDGTADGKPRIYRDGVLDATGPALTGTIVNSGAALSVGNGTLGYSFAFFTGWIDDVRVYGRALNDAEISAIYAGGADGNINL